MGIGAWSSDSALGAMSRAALFGRGPQLDTIYREDPVAWCVERMDVPEHTIRWSLLPEYRDHQWDGTPDPLVRILEGLAAGKDVGVESGTGTGKTYLVALITLWFLACWESIVVTGAPKEDQLLLHAWKEIGGLWPRFRRLPVATNAAILSGKIRMMGDADEKERWAATAFVAGVAAEADSAAKAQGFHAEHMLIVTEETPGMNPAIMNAFENTSTAEHNVRLAVGNPDHQQDPLHAFCRQPGTLHIRISALDHPNVVTGRTIVPGAVSRASVERRFGRYGHDSRLANSRIRGISPAESKDALIRRAWIDAAIARYQDTDLRTQGYPALGVDVANSENGDEAAIARGIGACCLEVSSFPCPDSNKLGQRVRLEMRVSGVEARHVGVDSIGVGAGTVNRLKEAGEIVRALNGAEKAIAEVDWDLIRDAGVAILPEEEYYNLRAQMWWQLRLDLQHGRIALPDDEFLIRELTVVTWTTRNGRILIESKEDLVKRLGGSPNRADAVVYWNFARYRRPIVEEPEQRSAFDPDVLEEEYRESHTVKEQRFATVVVDPMILEWDPDA